MEENKLVPKLRFPEFGGEWKEKRLEEITKINPKNSNLPNEFIYINLESVVGGILVKENKIEKNDAPSRAQRILEDGDILYQTVRPYQKNNLLFNLGKGYVASTGYAQIRTENNSIFIYQLLHQNKFTNDVLLRCTGTSYPSINANDLGEIKLNIPSLPEQQKIADFLSTVDDQIELLTKRKESIDQYKKGAMQKIFSQEVRFSDDDGEEYPEWEEKKLGEICEKIRSGGTPKSDKTEYYNGDLPFLSIKDITKQGKYINKTEKNITELGFKNSSTWRVPINSLIYSMYASVGFVSINAIELTTSQAILGIIPKDGIALNYLYYYLQNFKKYIKKFIETGTQGNLNLQIVKDFSISLPCLEEQQKIANFLSSVDAKIDQVEKRLESMKEWKKGLLQKMFV